MVSWDLKLLNKVLYFVIIANSAVDLCSNHSAQINGSMANTTASRVDQDGLLKVSKENSARKVSFLPGPSPFGQHRSTPEQLL